MKGEHFVTADLLNLIPGSSSSTREPKTEAASRELAVRIQLGQPSYASEDSSPASQAFRQVEGGGRLERSPLARKGSLLAPQASKKKKETFKIQKVAGAGAKHFIPWVPLISCRPPD